MNSTVVHFDRSPFSDMVPSLSIHLRSNLFSSKRGARSGKGTSDVCFVSRKKKEVLPVNFVRYRLLLEKGQEGTSAVQQYVHVYLRLVHRPRNNRR